jgi:hypothetical protein
MYGSGQSARCRRADHVVMHNFIKNFVRVAPGMWACVRNGEIHGPQGRIEVTLGSTFRLGTRFMGVDLAGLLEEEFHKVNGGVRPQASEGSAP